VPSDACRKPVVFVERKRWLGGASTVTTPDDASAPLSAKNAGFYVQ
jgi:hypothetical protein